MCIAASSGKWSAWPDACLQHSEREEYPVPCNWGQGGWGGLAQLWRALAARSLASTLTPPEDGSLFLVGGGGRLGLTRSEVYPIPSCNVLIFQYISSTVYIFVRTQFQCVKIYGVLIILLTVCININTLDDLTGYGQTAELHALMAHGGSMGISRGVTTLLDELEELKPTLLFAVPQLFKKVCDAIHAKVCRRSDG